MASERCATCGTQLPTGARFCSSCGTAVDDGVVVLDLDAPRGRGSTESDDDGGGSTRTAPTVVAILVVVVLVIVILSMVGGGEDDADSVDRADDAPDTTTSTTTPPRPSPPVEQPSDGAGESALLAPDPDRMGSIPGMALVRSDGSAVTVADLGTGAEVSVPEALPTGAERVIWTGDHLAALGGMGRLHLRSPLGETWVEVDLGPYRTTWGFAGGPLVPLSGGDGLGGDERVARVTEDGAIDVLEFPVEVWDLVGRPYVLGDGSFVVSVDGAIYLMGGGRTPERHAFGRALGARGDFLVRRSCDEGLRCELLLDDLSAGTTSSLGPVVAGERILAADPSPDGSSAAVVQITPGAAGLEIGIRNGSGAQATYEYGVWMGEVDLLRWSDDGEWLVWPNFFGGSIDGLRWSDPDAEPVSVAVDGTIARRGFDPNQFLVVPLSAVPESWRPGSD